MAATQLLQLAKDGDFSGFETQCLEALTGGKLGLAELVPPLRLFQGGSFGSQVASLGCKVLDQSDAAADPQAALSIARIAAFSDPTNDAMRPRLAKLYRAAFGQTPGFDGLLETSGLESGRPIRNAIRLLDLCLSLQKGEALISRTEDVVVEVLEVDPVGNLYSVRRDGRARTVTALELAREYERVDADDIRVLRQLYPKKLAEMLKSDPVAVVIGVMRSHGGQIDQDTLKAELCPRFVVEKEWSTWWTTVRALLKKNEHISVEGRSPVILTYRETAETLEDETWTAFVTQKDPHKWLAVVEGYLREKKKEGQPPDNGFLARCHKHLVDYIRAIGSKRPAEALGCALITEKLDAAVGLPDSEAKALAVEMLRTAPDPVGLIEALDDKAIWDLALSALEIARPAEVAGLAVRLFPMAPAVLLDDLTKLARKGDQLAGVQVHIDKAIDDPVGNAEIIYWLWKGSSQTDGLTIPAPGDLFTRITETLSALGRSLVRGAEATKNFRARMKSALSLKDFAAVKAVLEKINRDRAITLKAQFSRLDGLGDNTPARLLDILRYVHPELWKVVEVRMEQWQDEATLWTTRAGIQRKTEERDHLMNVTMRENAKRIGEAAALGDLSENSEYKFALEERDLLRARLAQMNNELSVSQVIEPLDVPTDKVGVGSRVTFRETGDGKEWKLTFLGPFDADIDRGIYNYKAPMAQKIMGQRVGDKAMLAFEGREFECEITRIENGLTS